MFRKKKNVKMPGSISPETTGYAAYAFVVPLRDSVSPLCLIRTLENSGFPCFLVFHDHDTDPYGRRKFYHYHVMVLYDEEKTAAPVVELCNAVCGSGPQIVHNPHAFARYLCHLDNPDKHQYSLKEVFCINGCIYEEFIK